MQEEMDRLLALRADMTQRQGASALDVVLPSWTCRACDRPVVDPALRTIGQVAYRELDGLIRQAREVGEQIVHATRPRCPDCGRKAVLRHVDYHAWHSGEGRDLVVRVTPARRLLGRARRTLLWWSDADGHRPAELDAAATEALTRDALQRQVTLWLERNDTPRTVAAIAEAADALAGDSVLLSYIPFLLDCGSATGLAGGIVEAHVARRPEDPEGHYWLGRVILDLVGRAVWPPHRLADAQAHLETCLRLDPTHPRVEAALEESARLAEATGALEAAGEADEAKSSA